jgi:hypothetical protein
MPAAAFAGRLRAATLDADLHLAEARSMPQFEVIRVG